MKEDVESLGAKIVLLFLISNVDIIFQRVKVEIHHLIIYSLYVHVVILVWETAIQSMNGRQSLHQKESGGRLVSGIFRYYLHVLQDTCEMIPFSYCIPDEYIVKNVPEKTKVFSDIVPGGKYLFGPGQQEQYYDEYKCSRFAVTTRKGGWDCLRHYEIIACGCIPIFTDLELCPTNTMYSFPKSLVIESNRKLLPWKDEYEDIYKEYVEKLLAICRERCSVSARTSDFLRYFPGARRILMINGHMGENYTRELLSIGLRRKLGTEFVEYPRNDVLYSSTDLSTKYGYGFSYGGCIEDEEIDRSSLEEKIKSHYFDVIILGKVGYDDWSYQQFPNFNVVRSVYHHTELALLYGGDGMQTLHEPLNNYTQHLYTHLPLGMCFVRELF